MTNLADKRLTKRLWALHRKQGVCGSCAYRDLEHMHHGAAHCIGNFRRQHPTCAEDAREPRYRVDVGVINELRDRE